MCLSLRGWKDFLWLPASSSQWPLTESTTFCKLASQSVKTGSVCWPLALSRSGAALKLRVSNPLGCSSALPAAVVPFTSVQHASHPVPSAGQSIKPWGRKRITTQLIGWQSSRDKACPLHLKRQLLRNFPAKYREKAEAYFLESWNVNAGQIFRHSVRLTGKQSCRVSNQAGTGLLAQSATPHCPLESKLSRVSNRHNIKVQRSSPWSRQMILPGWQPWKTPPPGCSHSSFPARARGRTEVLGQRSFSGPVFRLHRWRGQRNLSPPPISRFHPVPVGAGRSSGGL